MNTKKYFNQFTYNADPVDECVIVRDGHVFVKTESTADNRTHKFILMRNKNNVLEMTSVKQLM